MTTITILLEEADCYRARAGDKESTGRTAGEALDALTSQFSDDDGDTFVIVQEFKADEFFSAAQRARLTELMQLREDQTLSQDEEQELEGLVEAELNGARLRAESKLDQRRRANAEVRQRLALMAKEGRKQSRRLSAALSGLTKRESELLYLTSVEGLSAKEVAAELNEDVKLIYVELQTLRAKLRYHIAKLLKESKADDGEPASQPVPDASKA